MASSIQEVSCPPDQLEADVVAVVLFDQGLADGPAGLLARRLKNLLSMHPVRQSILVRSNHKVAAKWVLFYPAQDEDPEPLLDKLLQTCRQIGFARLALAAPESAAGHKNTWNRALSRAADREGFTGCLVTYDQSYLHDHSGPVF